jgi:DNA-binding transcriptional ArsR family regulator
VAKGRRGRELKTPLRALGHDLRRSILRMLIGREGDSAVSPLEVSEALGKPLATVSYHVRVLAECEAITRVEARQARGRVQHFYRPCQQFVTMPGVASILGLDPAAGGA